MQVKPKSFSQIIAQNKPNPTLYYPPYLMSGTLTMIYAPRGVGKSQYCFFLGLALAKGERFATGKCERSRVCYIDGEMGGNVWVRRLPKKQILGKVVDDNFGLLCPEDFKDCAIPSIGDDSNHKYYIETVKDYDIVFIDNYLTTCYQGKRGDDEISLWQSVQRLLIKLREMDKAVVLVHHTSKSGVQYGSILKENLMDTIIRIRKFPEQLSDKGLTLELKVEKDRHNSFAGNLETCLQMDFSDEAVTTERKDITALRMRYLVEKKSKGLIASELAERLNCSVADVKELLAKIDEELGYKV